MTNTGWYLRKKRSKKGISLDCICGILSNAIWSPSKGTLSYYETGRGLPKIENLDLLASAYGIDEEVLIRFWQIDVILESMKKAIDPECR